MPLRIAICCCTCLFGEGLKKLIEEGGLGEVEIINCPNPEDVKEAKPDLLIIDFQSLACIPLDSLFEQRIKILLLGTGCLPKIENRRLMEFISRGLVGILSPMTDSSKLRKAIKSVASGELWLNRRRVGDMLSELRDFGAESRPTFTEREAEIIRMICKGYANKEIMNSLSITEPAVKKHLSAIYSAIYRKTGVSDRLQLAVYAFQHLRM